MSLREFYDYKGKVIEMRECLISILILFIFQSFLEVIEDMAFNPNKFEGKNHGYGMIHIP